MVPIFFELGYILGTQKDSENRIVAGVALPIRAYAASFAAIGAITGRLSRPINIHEASERFRQLSMMPTGIKLYYRRENGERITVTFDGVTNDATMIKLRSVSYTYSIPCNLALRVEFPDKEAFSSPGRAHKQINLEVPPFLSHFFNSDNTHINFSQSRLDCIIIGSVDQLYQEINYPRFAVRSINGEYIEGRLQDIIRARRFSTHAATYRSDIFYTHSKEATLGSRYEMASIAIFDGAKSYLKWGNSCRYPHSIVLLTQTEPDFDAAIQVFNESFLKNHLDDVIFKKPLNIPKGITISIYQETKK